MQLMFLYVHAAQASICHVFASHTAQHWRANWPTVSLCWWVPPLMNISIQQSDIFIMRTSFHPHCSKTEVSVVFSEKSFRHPAVSIVFALSHQQFFITTHSSPFVTLVQNTVSEYWCDTLQLWWEEISGRHETEDSGCIRYTNNWLFSLIRQSTR